MDIIGKHEDWNLYDDYFIVEDDLKDMTKISFREHPKSGYIVRTRSTILSCSAINTNKIRVKCNSQWINNDMIEISKGIDPITKSNMIRASIDMSRQLMDSSISGTFSLKQPKINCQCYGYGSNEKIVVKSDTATLKLAYIRKHFFHSPSSEKIHEGKMIQMPCTPPEADPPSEIKWYKDGIEINNNFDSNFILANDGSLIISSARLNDSGNYTCEAKNLANKRSSDPAELTVFVNGGWSPWSEWSGSCYVNCDLLVENVKKFNGDQHILQRLLPSQRRTRLCNNPPPLNGGEPCTGEEEQFNGCPYSCEEFFGQWSEWTSWSKCSNTCQKTRNRKCQDYNNGRLSTSNNAVCLGPSQEHSFCINEEVSNNNCSTLKNSMNPSYNNIGESQSTFGNIHNQFNDNHYSLNNMNNQMDGGMMSNNNLNIQWNTQFVALSILGLVSFVILLLLFIILTFMCFKRLSKTKRKKESRCHHYDKDTVRTVLLHQHPNTQASLANKLNMFHYDPLDNPNNSPFPYNFTLNSKMSGNSNYSFKNSGNKSTCSTALIVNFDNCTNPKYHHTKALSINADNYSSDDNYASLYDIDTETIQHSSTPASNKLYQENVKDRFATIIAASIEPCGGKIKLQKNGAALFISEGTFIGDKMLFLALSDDLKDMPSVGDDEHHLSSLVMCGVCENENSGNSTFKDDMLKPIVLTFDHNASLFPKDNWIFTLYANYGLNDGWHAVNSFSSSETISKWAENDSQDCIFMVEREKCHVMSQRFGQFLLVGKSKKKSNQPSKRIHISAYISCSEFNASRVCPSSIRLYFVPETGMAVENVRKQEEKQGYLVSEVENFLLKENGSLCCKLYDENFQEIQSVEINESNHNWCSQNGLHIAVNLPSQKYPFIGHVTIYQNGNNSTEPTELSINLIDLNPNNIMGKSVFYDDKLVSNDFLLNSMIKTQLAYLIDKEPFMLKSLAKKLSMEQHVSFFKNNTMSNANSPTALCLELWESVNEGSERAVLDLLQTIRVLGSTEGVILLEKYVASLFDYN
uniref:Netrin receptor UNC5 n=1 Tax=Parastrongyloides trichosuri TaxID=131310 RepID=A0A0N4Z9P1_PARTI